MATAAAAATTPVIGHLCYGITSVGDIQLGIFIGDKLVSLNDGGFYASWSGAHLPIGLKSDDAPTRLSIMSRFDPWWRLQYASVLNKAIIDCILMKRND
jgi:hypothetical protein